MGTRVNGRLLGEKLAAMGKAATWSPKVLSRLEELVREGEEAQLFRVNPLDFAARKAIAGQEATDLFLHAAKAGLFHMEWNLVCPSCGDAVESFRTLSALHSSYHCSVCDMKSEAALDDYIQVTFTVSPDVREIAFHHPENLSAEDFHYKYHFSTGAKIPGGPHFAEAVPMLVKSLGFVGPDQRKRFALESSTGTLVFSDLAHHASATVPVDGQPAGAAQNLAIRIEDGKLVPDLPAVSPGKLVVTVENRMPGRGSVMVMQRPPGAVPLRLEFAPFLSGRKLITTQTFRTLFSSEVIRGNDGISVRDITILFTDLKGSTALYERIGDLKAFSLVQQHFDKLSGAVVRNNGAFVKTIGDAVMASFLTPLDAVRAARDMLKEIARFNQGLASRDLLLKIGMHAGPCIAVTLNERLDYFGQSVNIAARVQGLAGAEEVYVTDAVFGFPGVKRALAGFKAFSGKVRLKGIAEDIQVYRIAAAAQPGKLGA